MSRRVVAESLAQPLADERREADLAGLSGHEAAPCDWSGSQGHAGARKTRMCTAGGALVIVAYAEQLGASVATLCYAFAYLSRDLGAVCPGGLGWHVGSIAGPTSGRECRAPVLLPVSGLSARWLQTARTPMRDYAMLCEGLAI